MAATVTQIRPNKKIKTGAEYVSGSSYMIDQPRVLPGYEDFNTQQGLITHEVIDAMLLDPDVYAGLMLIALMALNEKLLITPAITETPTEITEKIPQPATDAGAINTGAAAKPVDSASPTLENMSVTEEGATDQPSAVNPDVELAKEIADFCNRQIARVPKFAAIIFEMVFQGMAHGNKVAEQVLEVAPRGTDAGKWCLKALKTKPREAVAFVVDAYMNELGLLGAKPGQASVTLTTIVPNSDEIIPREKFAVFTYRSENGDMRGNTALAAALNGWTYKQRTFPEYLLFLMVSAIPGILATVSPEAEEITLYEDDGVTPKRDENGETITIQAHQFLLNMLAKMRNHQVGVAPSGTNFTLLEANSEGEVFTKALDKFGSEITMAILFQQLATRDSKHQTKGATGEQINIIDYIVWWVRDNAADMIRYDILKPLVRYNYGDDVADELLPLASYGDTEARDWSSDANAAAQLADKLTESQWLHITTQLGIPAPTAAETAFKRMAKQLSMQGQQKALESTEDDATDQNKNKASDKPSNNKKAGDKNQPSK